MARGKVSLYKSGRDCPMCSNPYDDRVEYKIFKDDSRENSIRVCGRCFLLVNILDEIKFLRKEVSQWLTSKTSESLPS